MKLLLKPPIIRILLVVAVLVPSLLVLRLFIFSDEPRRNDDAMYREAFSRSYRIFAVPIPESLDFAGEPVPIDNYWVREALDRELMVNTYWHSNTLLCIKRAFRYFPVIESILKEEKVPDDMKYIAVIESGLTQAVSPAKATGFWQFMKPAAQQYGLTVTENVDERYHIEKSTRAAARFLKDLHRRYGSWAMAAAAYNMGPGALNSQRDFQLTTNYYDLLLNQETSRYVYRIMAMKLIVERPANYGFYLRRADMYLPIPTYTLTVDTSITSLVDFAKVNNVSYRTLKEFNPWLRERSLINRNRDTFGIVLPKPGYESWKKLYSTLIQPDMLVNDTLQTRHLR